MLKAFHLGCDETQVSLPLCTLNATKAVEVGVSEAVHKLASNRSGHNNGGGDDGTGGGGTMWPMGWEEFLSRANASASVGPGTSGVIIEAWNQYTAADVVKLGYRAVEANGPKFYLNHLHPTAYQWSDIGANISASPTSREHELMLGGEICMWTLEYRPQGDLPDGYKWQCDPADKHGCGLSQFPPSEDKMFSESFGGIVWPVCLK